MLLWVDGYDHYGGTIGNLTAGGAYSEVHDAGFSGIVLSTAQARTGTHSVLINDNSSFGGAAFGSYYRKAFPNGALTKVGIGFASYLPALPAVSVAQRVIFRDFNNADQFYVHITTTGAIQAVRADGTVLGTTSGPVITAAAWNHIEIYTEMSQTVGVVKVYINEVLVLNVTGVDNVNTALVETSQFIFRSRATSGESATSPWYIDDLFIYDETGTINNTAPLGDLNAYMLVPVADTAEADWTKSTGTDGYALIDETTPNDADYIQAANAGDRSDFDLTDIPTTINFVAGLFAHTRALKTDAGGAVLRTSIQQGSDTLAGDNKAITTAATWWFQEFEIDPSTGARFNREGVNTAKVRFDRIT